MTHTRQLIATATLAASALFSAGAFAQEATPDTWTHVYSTETRAAVVADLFAARDAGLDEIVTEGYLEPADGSMVQRAAVRRETLRAIRSGEVRAINAEAHGMTHTA